MAENGAKLFFADACYVNGRELRQDVAIIVRDGIIEDIVSRDYAPESASAESYRFQLLLPGFINSHCHLEYTGLYGKLPRGESFAHWVRAIISAKKELTEDDYGRAAREGISRLIDGGCTTVIDCTSSGSTGQPLVESSMRFVLLHELLGLSAAQADTTMAQAIPRLENPPDSSFRIASGINPHAPYSVGRELRNLIRDYLAGHPGVPCAWHLHESWDEINYFATGTGTLAELLASLGSPAPFDETPACAAMEFLGREGLLNSVNIAFHLNFSTDDEAQLFAAPRGVVHCPPAHAYFGREPFPMYRMMNAGANVCLGTDSLASGQTLSMFEVLRMAAREFPFLSGGQLLALVTTNPARMTVLANAPPLGVIARGAAADFASFSAPATVTRELRALLMDSRTEVRDVFVAGAQLNG